MKRDREQFWSVLSETLLYVRMRILTSKQQKKEQNISHDLQKCTEKKIYNLLTHCNKILSVSTFINLHNLQKWI